MQQKLGVFIGRMQPPHKAHIQIIKRILRENSHALVILGSCWQFPTIKNPFEFWEREEMIRSSLSSDENDRLFVSGVADYVSDNIWAKEIQSCVEFALSDIVQKLKVRLYGHTKDDSSYYLKMFPNWEFVEVENLGDKFHSSSIRTMMFKYLTISQEMLEEGVYNWLDEWFKKNSEYFIKEYNFIEKYKQSWSNSPYPPVFVTTDSCVVCSGHVLLVTRKAEPCAGAWALPGGFINQNETLVDACIRELKEETKIKVPVPVLKGSIKGYQVFDAPDRSLRGRTITHAYYIELPPGELPKTKAADDALKTFWIPLNEVMNNREKFFEDHFQIICALAQIS